MSASPITTLVAPAAPAKGVQGKYGLYLVDKETFLNLKAQHKTVLAEYKAIKRSYAYYRKDAKNRPEGTAPVTLLVSNTEDKFAFQCDVQYVKKMYLNLLKAYQMARKCYTPEALDEVIKPFELAMILSGSPTSHGIKPPMCWSGMDPRSLGLAAFLYADAKKF